MGQSRNKADAAGGRVAHSRLPLWLSSRGDSSCDPRPPSHAAKRGAPSSKCAESIRDGAGGMGTGTEMDGIARHYQTGHWWRVSTRDGLIDESGPTAGPPIPSRLVR